MINLGNNRNNKANDNPNIHHQSFQENNNCFHNRFTNPHTQSLQRLYFDSDQHPQTQSYFERTELSPVPSFHKKPAISHSLYEPSKDEGIEDNYGEIIPIDNQNDIDFGAYNEDNGFNSEYGFACRQNNGHGNDLEQFLSFAAGDRSEKVNKLKKLPVIDTIEKLSKWDQVDNITNSIHKMQSYGGSKCEIKQQKARFRQVSRIQISSSKISKNLEAKQVSLVSNLQISVHHILKTLIKEFTLTNLILPQQKYCCLKYIQGQGNKQDMDQLFRKCPDFCQQISIIHSSSHLVKKILGSKWRVEFDRKIALIKVLERIRKNYCEEEGIGFTHRKPKRAKTCRRRRPCSEIV